MSQMVTRKSVGGEEIEKRQTDSPVKDMKKKVAANAEKEKQAAEKTEKPTEKQPEKSTDKKVEKNGGVVEKKADSKQAEKKDGHVDKKDGHAEKKDGHPEKKDGHTEKKEGPAEKRVGQAEKKDAEKKDARAEKKDEKGEKSGKGDKADKDQKPKEKPKQNGSKAHNGVADVTLNSNGTGESELNGTVSEEDEDAMLVIDYEHDDDLFPELKYDDTSDDAERDGPSRSFTRRSQVKSARTPETPAPRPASDKLAADKEAPADDSKDSKILKLKEDASGTDRKLRSTDPPKPESKKAQDKQDAAKKTESPKKQDKEDCDKKGGKGQNGTEVEIVVELETEEEQRKTDTNYSKSRVKVSPYRRSGRIADQTASSVLANYTGNNSTMEMDITETSSIAEDASLNESSYLSGLRGIRGRRSYKLLKEMPLRHVVNRSVRSTTNVTVPEPLIRPMAPVVGRKRKPETDDGVEVATEAGESVSLAHTKRMRLLDRIAQPFRRTIASTPLPARRNDEAVGINSDLSSSVPFASAANFGSDLCQSVNAAPATPEASLVSPDPERDPKRCVVM